jgi:hypothetical protein
VKQFFFASAIADEGVVHACGKSQLSSFLWYVTCDSCLQELFIRFQMSLRKALLFFYLAMPAMSITLLVWQIGGRLKKS